MYLRKESASCATCLGNCNWRLFWAETPGWDLNLNPQLLAMCRTKCRLMPTSIKLLGWHTSSWVKRECMITGQRFFLIPASTICVTGVKITGIWVKFSHSSARLPHHEGWTHHSPAVQNNCPSLYLLPQGWLVWAWLPKLSHLKDNNILGIYLPGVNKLNLRSTFVLW